MSNAISIVWFDSVRVVVIHTYTHVQNKNEINIDRMMLGFRIMINTIFFRYFHCSKMCCVSHVIENLWHLIFNLLIAILTNTKQTVACLKVFVCINMRVCVRAFVLAIIQSNNNQNETKINKKNVLKLEIGWIHIICQYNQRLAETHCEP